VKARDEVSRHYHQIMEERGSSATLKFTLDGNLIGDIGEAIAVQLFGVKLHERKAAAGTDGLTLDGKHTVQVKATGTNRGPAFRNTEKRADFLLFFELDLKRACGSIIFNGPEHYAFRKIKPGFKNQRVLEPKRIREADKEVQDHERLPLLITPDGWQGWNC
jgi:hypothetical protein